MFGGLFSMLKYFKGKPDELAEVQSEYKDAGAAATPDDLKKNFKSTNIEHSLTSFINTIDTLIARISNTNYLDKLFKYSFTLGITIIIK